MGYFAGIAGAVLGGMFGAGIGMVCAVWPIVDTYWRALPNRASAYPQRLDIEAGRL